MTSKERLFAAAKNIYERDGLAGLTIRAVGRNAEMSAMAIYRHFPDKNALIDALMHDGFDAWEAIVRKIDLDDPILWLKSAVMSYAEFALTDPHRFDAAFLLPAPQTQTFPLAARPRRFSVIKGAVAQIEKAQTQGRLLDEPPMHLTLMMSALAQGLVSMHRAGRLGSDEQFRASYKLAMDRFLASFITDRTMDQSTRKTKKRRKT